MKHVDRPLVALVLLISVACTSAETQPPATPSGSTSSSVRALAASDCLEFPCQGLLEPGEYRSTLFDPTIDFEATSPGWTWDYFGTFRSGNFRLIADESHELPYDSDGIYFLLDPAIASRDCEETEEPGVGRSVDDLVAWLVDAPGLALSEPKPVTVGGFDGVQLDLKLDPTWKKTCVFSEGSPAVPLIIHRADVGAYHVVILPGVSMRWYILDSGDGVIIVDIDDGPDGLSRGDLLRTGSEIVESFVFSSPS
jgi:hypothetical protein